MLGAAPPISQSTLRFDCETQFAGLGPSHSKYSNSSIKRINPLTKNEMIYYFFDKITQVEKSYMFIILYFPVTNFFFK